MSLFGKWGSEHETIGLDIGSHSVKVAKLTFKNSQYIAHTLAHQPLPFGTLVEGEILDSFTLEESIKDLFKKNNLRTQQVALALGGEHVIVKKISIPTLSQAEVKDQISILATQFLGIVPEDFQLDFQVLSQNDTLNSHLLLVAVQKKYLESYLSLLEACDLKPTAIDTLPTAITSFYHTKDSAYAILHMGAGLSHFIVVEQNVPVFYKPISFGGDTLTQDIREHMQLSFAEAEALKITPEKEKYIPKEILEIAQTSFEKCLHGLEQCSQTVTHQFPQLTLKYLYLSGGASKMTVIQDWLERRLSLKTSDLPFLSNISLGTSLNLQNAEELAPFFPVALSLAGRDLS